MNNKRKIRLNLLEIVSLLFVAFFLYNFFLKEEIAYIKFKEVRQEAMIAFQEINKASLQIKGEKDFSNLFEDEKDIIKNYSEFLKTDYTCKDSKKEKCWSKNWLWERLKKPGITTKENQYIVSELSSAKCKNNKNIADTCGALYIDVNGEKQPNKIGVDIIKVYITKDKIIPAGVFEDEVNPPTSCNFINKFSFGCSAKLLGIR